MSKTQRRSATTLANKRRRADQRAKKLANHAARILARKKLREERNIAKGIPRKKRAMLSKKEREELAATTPVAVVLETAQTS